MKKFLFALWAVAGVAAYAGYAADRGCGWAQDGYVCGLAAIEAQERAS